MFPSLFFSFFLAYPVVSIYNEDCVFVDTLLSIQCICQAFGINNTMNKSCLLQRVKENEPLKSPGKQEESLSSLFNTFCKASISVSFFFAHFNMPPNIQ